jgi:hypothetical protein
VRVVWRLDREDIWSSTAPVPAGAKQMTFILPKVVGGEPGSYRVAVWSGDDRVAAQRFEILNSG